MKAKQNETRKQILKRNEANRNETKKGILSNNKQDKHRKNGKMF
jgi:hypothetical protein